MDRRNLIDASKNMRSSQKYSHLHLLLWKNLKLQRRSLLGAIIELAIPAIFVMILLPIRTIVNSDQKKNFTTYRSYGLDMFDFELLFKNFSFGYYSNNSTVVDNVVQKTAKKLNLDYKWFNSEPDMVSYVSERNDKYLFAVTFMNESISNFTYKLRFSYAPRVKLRDRYVSTGSDWKTNLLFTIFPVLGPRDRVDNYGGEPGYFREGFLQVQKAIDFALISEYDPNVNYIDLRLQRFPYPPYNEDKFVVVIIAVLPFIIMLSFIFTVILTAKSIVHEKETGLKQAMLLTGLRQSVYWLSWYIKTLIMLLPSLIIMIISYKMKLTLGDGGTAAIIDKTSTAVLSLFFFLHASSLITFTFVCTTFFKKANNAATGAGMIYFFTYLPYIFISLRYESLNLAAKIGSCFISNLAMCLGVQLIGIFEGQGIGIDFATISRGNSTDDSFSILNVLVVMVLNNFIHIFLTYYFDNVIQGDYGIAKPWYFLFCSKNNTVADHRIKNSKKMIADQEEDSVFLENESSYAGKYIGIKIKNLCKDFTQFGIVKSAVKNLSLNIYEGHITVLLGHNGAGKSTTIGMITGLTAPTDGEIIFDKSLENNGENNTVLGYCPQYNLLFDNLTVLEHLIFFAKLKQNYRREEIDEMLDLIELRDKKNCTSNTLSGGMKRKLSVAVAFIGGSKVVVLDEPSSGMDPQARHSTWTLLQKFKKERNCTILLTTHFMDEADFLGDRIAIMSKGSLRCAGSPLFLKSTYGSGYNLTITRKGRSLTEEDLSRYTSSYSNLNSLSPVKVINLKTITKENCENVLTQKIISMVKSKIPNSKLKSNLHNELTFLLPAQDSHRFPDLFDLLDRFKNDFDILNIGISITTVEEIFLKVESTDEEVSGDASLVSFKTERDTIEDEETYYGLWTGSKPEDLNKGFHLYIQQLKALFIKRFIHSTRNKSLILSQVFLPILILLINLVYLKYGPIIHVDSPPLNITLASYGQNYAPYHVIDTISPALKHMASIYGKQLASYAQVKGFNLNNRTEMIMCSDSRESIDDYLVAVGKLSFMKLNEEHFLAADFTMKEPFGKPPMKNLTPISLQRAMNSPNPMKIFQNMFKFGKRQANFNSRKRMTVIGHFNNQPYHVPPLAVNLLTNTLLRYFSRSMNTSINVINHPLPRNLTDITNEISNKDLTSFNIASGLTFGFSFLIASFSIILIKERVSGSKHLQFMNGCNSTIFWLSAFIWDMLNYLIPVFLVIGVLKLFNVVEYVDEMRWSYTLLILFVYGLAHIPQAYLFSYKFEVSASGFAIITAWNIISSQATLLPVRILSLPMLKLIHISLNLETIFMVLFPNYAMGQSLIEMYANHQAIKTCKNVTYICSYARNPCCRYENLNETNPCGDSDCLYWNENYWTWEKPGILKFILCMIAQFLVQMLILVCIEAGVFKKIKYWCVSSHKIDNTEQILNEKLYGDVPKDSDVIKEEMRIERIKDLGRGHDEIFIVDKLTKHYKNFLAVKGISFTMKRAQCFGLLGVNGAGKTSTFKMITGDEFITSGETHVKDISIKRDFKKFQRQLGYCPQFDPLIAQMTVLETMYMFARLRGIRSCLIQKTCASLIGLLDLSDHVNKMCRTLSGGNKRKLSVAIALVGSPVVVLLDEPTSGMDPKARRVLWDSLNRIRDKGKSLILTTHSMDETEALCTNIGIMVNGELKCLGSLQHLKDKYGEGYTLLAKIAASEKDCHKSKEERIKRFINFILISFKNSELKENRDGFINMHIQSNIHTALSTIFAIIENNKDKYFVEYYVVTQTKLEQIFLNFAGMQVDANSRLLTSGSILANCCV